ncbi:MAG: hypothetical protein ACKD6N_04855 [Candidatus Bathyarchaeota archaeon]
MHRGLKVGDVAQKLKGKLEVWREILPPLRKIELHRLKCRLKRYATIFSSRTRNGHLVLLVGYDSHKSRVKSRVILSNWVGKGNYQSIKVSPSLSYRRKVSF